MVYLALPVSESSRMVGTLEQRMSVGRVGIMDNVATHKVSGVAEAIQAIGATLRYLPQ